MADALVRLGLVIGCAEGNFDEARAAIALQKPDLIYCVKLAGVHWPEPFDWWCGLHPEWMTGYMQQRAALSHPRGFRTATCLEIELDPKKKDDKFEPDRRVSYRWPGMSSSASSGIFAAKIALEDCEKVILAGVPMSNGNHFSRKRAWAERGAFLTGLEQAIPHMKGRVRSLSGKTKELLGAPDAEWLARR